MDPLLLLVGLTFAGGTSLAILYVYQRATAVDHAISARLAPTQQTDRGVGSALRGERRSRLPLVDLLPISPVARERMEIELDRAGVPLRVTEYVGLRIATAVAAAIVGYVVTAPLDIASLTVVGAMALFIVGWLAPRAWVANRRQKRLDAIDAQVADALTTLAKSLRAGTGLIMALSYTAEETPAPLGPELEMTLRELRLGAEPETAFSELSKRLGSADLDIAITAIIIQRTVGGNLSEILTNVATTIRERAKLYGEIRVITSRQKLLANMIAAVPPLIAVAFMLLNPDTGRLLFETTPGRIALAIGIAFELVGIWLVRRFAKVEV